MDKNKFLFTKTKHDTNSKAATFSSEFMLNNQQQYQNLNHQTSYDHKISPSQTTTKWQTEESLLDIPTYINDLETEDLKLFLQDLYDLFC